MSAPIEAGFFSLSEVTDSGDHRAYNEWHQLDHMPEQYQIPGIVIGERWVSTPACRNARVFSSAELDASQYLTLYLMSEPLRETIDRFFALGKSLARLGRFYEHRRSVLSGPFRVTVMRAAPRTLVSDGAVPFRPNLGVFVVVEHAPGPPATKGSLMKAGTETDEVRVQELLGQPGVAGVWTFRSIEAFLREGSEQNTRQVTICYLDEPPVDVSQNIGEIIRELWRADPQPEFAGPFEAITPWRWDWFDHPPGAEKS